MVDSGAEKKCFPKRKAAAKPRATAAASNSQSLRFRFVVLHDLMVVSLSKNKTKKGFSVQVSGFSAPAFASRASAWQAVFPAAALLQTGSSTGFSFFFFSSLTPDPPPAEHLKPQFPLFSLPLFPPSCSLKLAHFLLAGAILSAQFSSCSLRANLIGQK